MRHIAPTKKRIRLKESYSGTPPPTEEYLKWLEWARNTVGNQTDATCHGVSVETQTEPTAPSATVETQTSQQSTWSIPHTPPVHIPPPSTHPSPVRSGTPGKPRITYFKKAPVEVPTAVVVANPVPPPVPSPTPVVVANPVPPPKPSPPRPRSEYTLPLLVCLLSLWFTHTSRLCASSHLFLICALQVPLLQNFFCCCCTGGASFRVTPRIRAFPCCHHVPHPSRCIFPHAFHNR